MSVQWIKPKESCQKTQILPPTPLQHEDAICGLTVAAPATSPRKVTTRCSRSSPAWPQGLAGGPTLPGLRTPSSLGLWAPPTSWCSSAGRQPRSGWPLSAQSHSRSEGCHLRPRKEIINSTSVSWPPWTSESKPWPRSCCLMRLFGNSIG